MFIYFKKQKIFIVNYDLRTGGIPARTASGEKLSLYVGIIDILQSYQLRKKLEHTFKSVVTDGVKKKINLKI
jgi:hypothetical protein